MECENCGSKFKRRYEERRSDSFEVVEIVSRSAIGPEPKSFVPNYLAWIDCENFNQKSEPALRKRKLVKTSLKELVDYLFETQ